MTCLDDTREDSLTQSILTRGAAAPSLFYQDEGAGRPVMLIHGVGADSTSWDEIAPTLAQHFRVLRLDLRGHGRSGRIEGACALNDFIQDVIDIMDAAAVAKANVVGFSLGGLIAQGVALSHPDRVDRLALISAIAGRTEEEQAKVRTRLEVLRNKGIEAIMASAQERWFTPGFVEAFPEKVRDRMEQLKRNDPDSYKAAYTVFSTSELGDRLHNIRHRTLIVTGEHDIGSNTRMARYMHEQISDSELRILPGLRHSVLVEAPEQIVSLLMDFLT
jgi:(E)-2-((N-methylformamido)methylene)succinate hydrolase